VNPLLALRRHPFDVEAHFDFSLVLAYALPAPALEPLLAPGLELDRVGELGILAVALVQTRDLRPAGWPRALGRDFFLAGYRVFARLRDRPSIRGLRILRSDADSRLMTWAGNIFTRYGYELCRMRASRHDHALTVWVEGPAALRVEADLRPADLPPAGSPFHDLEEARRFAGPLPNTFGWEPETRSLVIVGSTRTSWLPSPVTVDVKQLAFLDRFSAFNPRLANAFYVENVDYRWKRGVREAVP
jgi:hypothetical protein